MEKMDRRIDLKIKGRLTRCEVYLNGRKVRVARKADGHEVKLEKFTVKGPLELHVVARSDCDEDWSVELRLDRKSRIIFRSRTENGFSELLKEIPFA